jgi:HD superfamily phosphohydrolase
MGAYKRIRVFADRDLRATRLEMAVIDTQAFQRLRTLRQLGQSYVAFPTAEHTRFAHSLGTLYWAAKMLTYLRENYFADATTGHEGNVTILRRADDAMKQTVLRGMVKRQSPLGVSYFEQFVRIAALIHDITHVPFGHTLEDQAELLPRHDEHPERIDGVFKRLIAELDDSPHLAGTDGVELRAVLVRILEQCELLYYIDPLIKGKSAPDAKSWKTIADRWNRQFTPFLTLAHDIVGNTICADLVDYLHRDMYNAGMPWTMDKILLSHLKLFRAKMVPSEALGNEVYRFGVAVGRSKMRHDVITAVLGLLRARYDLTEKVYYHHTKCAADAILEKAIRIDPTFQLTWELLIDENHGDETLLAKIAASSDAAAALVHSLRARRFHKAIYRIRDSHDWSPATLAQIEACRTPMGRSDIEMQIREHCPSLEDGQVIVSCLPKDMQLKQAKALIEWPDGDQVTLERLPDEKKYLPEIAPLTQRYKELWSLTVYLSLDSEHLLGAVLNACAAVFNRQNDPMLDQYLRSKYPLAFDVKELMSQISHNSELATVLDMNVAKGGGPANREKQADLVLLDKIDEEVKRKRLAGKDRLAVKKNSEGASNSGAATDESLSVQTEITSHEDE